MAALLVSALSVRQQEAQQTQPLEVGTELAVILILPEEVDIILIMQVVALAVLMPVVASMGGIAGSQTLTLIIRGLAMGQVTSANLKALMKKELSVGGLNGVLWAIVIGFVASMWFGSPVIGLVIAMAILVNIAAAALSGVAIPVLLDKMKLDPALSGSVVLTTVTDIVGFVAFLGLGTLLLV